jgi:hypothetical protein
MKTGRATRARFPFRVRGYPALMIRIATVLALIANLTPALAQSPASLSGDYGVLAADGVSLRWSDGVVWKRHL